MASQKIETWIPGLRVLRTYRREWFRSDLVAGLSVAAVALPIGIAYAQLAGFPPVVGIYSAILPPVAYALFGSSRQLIVNPDAAACAIVAATVALFLMVLVVVQRWTASSTSYIFVLMPVVAVALGALVADEQILFAIELAAEGRDLDFLLLQGSV